MGVLEKESISRIVLVLSTAGYSNLALLRRASDASSSSSSSEPQFGVVLVIGDERLGLEALPFRLFSRGSLLVWREVVLEGVRDRRTDVTLGKPSLPILMWFVGLAVPLTIGLGAGAGAGCFGATVFVELV